MEKIIVNNYEVELFFDESDKIYVAKAIAFPGCMAHGDTQEEAAIEISVAIALHIATAKQRNQDVPKGISIYHSDVSRVVNH